MNRGQRNDTNAQIWGSKTTRIMMATVPNVISGLGQKISGRWIFFDTSVPGTS